MLLRARSKGWRVVVFNSRGCAGSPVTTAKFYSASFTGDLRQVVDHVLERYPQSNIYAVGWSLGANILVRYLGEETDKCVLSGAVSLCNPFNLVIADEDFHKGFNNVYDRALAKALRNIFKKHALLFEGLEGEYNISKAANARSVRDFDEGLTRVSFGFKSVDDYYSNSSSSDSIKNVSIPLLCIQADNDPIAPSRGIPREDIKVVITWSTMPNWRVIFLFPHCQEPKIVKNPTKIKANPNCLLIVTPQGGHLGWVAGEDAPFGCPWTDPIIMEFLEYVHNEKNSSTKDRISYEQQSVTQTSSPDVSVHVQR
uniref:AB hydrolase-1 domain-containing protein n=2 Tax=Oryza brachyantha TaxID=4533 RepID=J3LFB3_ORYBR